MKDSVFAKKQLIPFVMAGYPTLTDSESLACEFLDQGCRVLEIGTPSADPLADGPLLQDAAMVAREQGGRLSKTLAMIRRLKDQYPEAHFVLFTYYSVLHTPGLDHTLKATAQAGASATLIVDLPPEEAMPVIQAQAPLGLRHVFLASPTTSSERLKKINELANFFAYYVSRAGVTGTQSTLSPTVIEELKNLRQNLHGPVAVGFGIRSADQVRLLAPHTNAVVIGSRFFELINETKNFSAARKAVGTLYQECAQAMELQ